MDSDLDLANCEIRTPTGDAALALFRMLMDAFPVDRPVFTEMIEKGNRFYTWTPYALYQGDELLGNASLMPVRIWLDGQPVEVVGMASVATREPYRRQGVARHLMRHALGIVDKRQAPAVLFTDLPVVYERLGFQAVRQTYLAASARRMELLTTGFACELVQSLDPGRVERMATIYAEEYPNYDGKIVRDADYWQLYEMLFNLYARPKILFCTAGGRVVAYLRCETEEDRLLVSELCSGAGSIGAAVALLGFAADYARQLRRDLVTFALPPGHFVKPLLQEAGVPLEPEPPGARRETFMVRPRAGESLGRLRRLQWSLADKF